MGRQAKVMGLHAPLNKDFTIHPGLNLSDPCPGLSWTFPEPSFTALGLRLASTVGPPPLAAPPAPSMTRFGIPTQQEHELTLPP